MPYASRASSSRSSAAATLGRLPLYSGVASPPLYVRRRPSAPSYLSSSRRCSRPQKKFPIPSGISYAPLPAYSSSQKCRLHPRRRRIARTAEMPCRRAPFRRSPSTRFDDEGRSNRSMVDNTDKEQRCHMDLQGGGFEGWLVLCNFGVNKSA
ncbi:hypothetical protein VPH35_127627 [Triticum aestivum]